MKNAKYADMCASVNYQFSKRCSSSEPILARLADDLIARYSPKHQPHPDFFKEDAALALNQLTLYIDQFIQVMRNYDFLQKAATIISALTTACLSINDFLGKQLYHYMKADQSNHNKKSTVTQFLCPACGKLRENQKIRVMRQELNVPHANWNRSQKNVKEVVSKNGEKYDVQELLREEMDNLDSLNQEEMRKRLTNMELDHDRRRQQMIVALEQLKRANDRVTSYGKTIEKKGKQWEGKFNVKDYVFQLSRHFYHNLSTIDSKIKHLKQNINPITNTESQTQEACVMISEHNELVEFLNGLLKDVQRQNNETKNLLIIQQRKIQQEDDMVKYLQQKLSKIEMQREDEKLKWSLDQKKLHGEISQLENKIQSSQYLLKKMKHILRIKNLGLEEDWQEDFFIKTQTVSIQVPQERSQARNSKVQNNADKYYSKSIKDSRLSWKQSTLLNPNSVLNSNDLDLNRIDNDREKGLKLSTPLSKIKSLKKKEDKTKKLQIFKVLSLCLGLSRTSSFKIIKCESQFIHGSMTQKYDLIPSDPKDLNEKISKKARLSKINSNTRQLTKKITTINNRKSMLILQNDRSIQEGKDDLQQTYLQEKNARKQREKRTLIDLRNLRNQYAEENRKIRIDLSQQKLNQEVNFAFRPKKRRNFSQEHSVNQIDYREFKKSLEKHFWNEKQIFTDLNNVLQIGKTNLDNDKKQKKIKNDFSKTALSLEEINFSTYLYSLTAQIHLKNPNTYIGLKKYLCTTAGYNIDAQNSIKNSLKILLINHRKCTSIKNGSICCHMQKLLEKIKQM